MISRWAPPSENDTESYIQFVAESSRIDPEDQVELGDRAAAQAVVAAMIHLENGVQPYDQSVFDAAFKLAKSHAS